MGFRTKYISIWLVNSLYIYINISAVNIFPTSKWHYNLNPLLLQGIVHKWCIDSPSFIVRQGESEEIISTGKEKTWRQQWQHSYWKMLKKYD